MTPDPGECVHPVWRISRSGGYVRCAACGHERLSTPEAAITDDERRGCTVTENQAENGETGTATAWWCITHGCWDGRCGVIGEHEAEARPVPQRMAPAGCTVTGDRLAWWVTWAAVVLVAVLVFAVPRVLP